MIVWLSYRFKRRSFDIDKNTLTLGIKTFRNRRKHETCIEDMKNKLIDKIRKFYEILHIMLHR